MLQAADGGGTKDGYVPTMPVEEIRRRANQAYVRESVKQSQARAKTDSVLDTLKTLLTGQTTWIRERDASGATKALRDSRRAGEGEQDFQNRKLDNELDDRSRELSSKDQIWDSLLELLTGKSHQLRTSQAYTKNAKLEDAFQAYLKSIPKPEVWVGDRSFGKEKGYSKKPASKSKPKVLREWKD